MRIATRRVGMLVGGALLLSACGVCAQDWPQWRGPNRDNKVTGFTAPKTWPKEPAQKWKVKVGLGESSPVLVGDKLYVFAREGGDEVVRCLDVGTGKEVWKHSYPGGEVNRAAAKLHLGPRSTPAVGEGKVCTLGVNGMVKCLDAATGKEVWKKETQAKPMFNTSSSPIIAEGKCIVFVGALTAYDLASGESKWQWSGARTPYGSPVLMTVEGTKQVVTPADGVIAGIALADGKELWKVDFKGTSYTSHFSTPVIHGQTVIYSGALGKGSAGRAVAFKVEKKGDGFATTPVWDNALAAHQYHTPVLKDDLLFGVSLAGRNFFCMDAKTGAELWRDKSTQRGECGHILNAGSVLVALTSDAQLVVFEPSNKEYKELAKYKVSDDSEKQGPWSCPIIAGNRVFVKDKAGSLALWTIE